MGDVEISDDEVHAEMQYHPAPSMEQARSQAALALVVRQLLLQQAKKQGLISGDNLTVQQESEAVDKLLAQEVKVPHADDSSCLRYYEQNKTKFVDSKTGEIMSFDMAKPYIRDYLHMQSMQMGISQYIKLLARKYKVAGFALDDVVAAGNSPLIQ